LIDHKDVIFLGAGASKSEGAPLQGELLKFYFDRKFEEYDNLDLKVVAEESGRGGIAQLIFDESIYMSDTESARSIRLIHFLENFFDLPVTDDNRKWLGADWLPVINSLERSRYPTFEEILGIVENAIERDEVLRKHDFDNDSENDIEIDLRQTRIDLIEAIAETLAKSLRGSTGDWHRKLVLRLAREKRLGTMILSTNYDILIDNAILRQRRPVLKPDYGIDIRDRRLRRGHSVKLYKLHGSLNWMFCPRCFEVSYTRTRKVYDIGRSILCAECNEKTNPMLIPPTFLKNMSNPYLQQVWLNATREIKDARRLIFCGYSLPEPDLEVKYLLKRAQLNRSKDSPSMEVFVINGERENSWEQNKFERFFGKTNVNYLQMNFETFALEGID
jgi:hypothetical protein